MWGADMRGLLMRPLAAAPACAGGPLRTRLRSWIGSASFPWCREEKVARTDTILPGRYRKTIIRPKSPDQTTQPVAKGALVQPQTPVAKAAPPPSRKMHYPRRERCTLYHLPPELPAKGVVVPPPLAGLRSLGARSARAAGAPAKMALKTFGTPTQRRKAMPRRKRNMPKLYPLELMRRP